jgi:hypothetical protein
MGFEPVSLHHPTRSRSSREEAAVMSAPRAINASTRLPPARCSAAAAQGLTLVSFSDQLERFL